MTLLSGSILLFLVMDPFGNAPLFLAWLATGILLLLSERMARFLGKRGITGLQRLMGLILTTIAVEMFIEGLKLLSI